MKKILTILAILMVTISAKAAIDWVEVSTAQEFYDAMTENSNVKLMADIDLSSLSAISSGDAEGYLFEEYTRCLDGNNHALKNSTHPLFYRVQYGQVFNIVLDGFTITDATSIIARTSYEFLFLNITVKNSSLTPNNAGSNIGMIAGYSKYDKFKYCTIEKGCTIKAKKEHAGCIAGYCLYGSFSYCYNAANISSDLQSVGGIVGYLGYGNLENCLNTGTVSGDAYVGGIAGFNYGSESICNNVNIGSIKIDRTFSNAYEGGIIGQIDETDESDIIHTVQYCMNFGSINSYYIYDSGDKYELSPMIWGVRWLDSESTYNDVISDIYYYCKAGGDLKSNLTDMGTSYEALMSGELVYKLNTTLYQDIDNNTFETHLPVPIPAAGTVYSNILCDGTQSYSNKYKSPAAHTSEVENGICTVCGAHIVHITNAEEFADFANKVKNGTEYSKALVYIDNDIDISSVSPINSGDEQGYLLSTFSGSLHGEGHTLKNSTSPLFYRTSMARIKNITLDGFSVTGNQTSLIARTSYATNFSNITVKNSHITASDNNNFGMIVGYSNADTISYCTVESGCYITADRRQIGGIAGEAYNGKISYCRNSATITGDADYIGGIVGLIEDGKTASTIEYCLNTGTIKGDDECGGIAGQYYNGTISHCVNIGTVTSKDGDNHSNVGGIVGKLCSATCNNSINFGSVVKAKSQNAQFAIYGGKDGTITTTDNEYYCDVKGKHFDSGLIYDDIMSGAYAYTQGWLYQEIDNNTYTVTIYPVPLSEAGTVLSNILCNGTQSYSNKFHSTSAHDSVDDGYGYCSVCGMMIGSDGITNTAHVTNAAELLNIATLVNKGKDFSKTTVYLDNDIDLSGVTFTPIGTTSNPFMGTFDGQGYRIKNMTINLPQGAIGLFGAVAGASTVIKNVIIDKSCSVKSTATESSSSYSGVAGLIGGVWSASGAECNVSIMNCGNEANVNGYNNVAGLLGGVYQNDATVVNVNNCYNTGTIGGSSESRTASIVGYARKHTNIRNTWNSGTVGGTYEYYTFAYMGADGFDGTIENCYTIAGKNATENSKSGVVTLDQNKYTLGALCQTLNKNIGSNTAWTEWSQDIATDTIPSFGDAGLHYTRTMKNQWGTICLPFDAEMGDEYDFYELSGVNNDYLTLTKVTTLAAGTPAILRRNAAASGVDIPTVGTTLVTTPNTGTEVGGLTLTGSFTSMDVTDKDGYIISNNAFWNISSIKSDYSSGAAVCYKVYCDPFRAYLAGSIPSGAKMLTIDIDDETTAVDALNAITEGEAEYYDLSGHKLNNLQKGINIVKFSNGVTKKIIIK